LLEESVLRRVKGDLELTGIKGINRMTEGIKNKTKGLRNGTQSKGRETL
jgi:hypothetical protein